MTWSRTYSHALLISVDMLGSAILWSNKTTGVTISSMCGLELRKVYWGIYYHKRLAWLGRMLNRMDANHCENAIESDLERLTLASALLNSIPKPVT